MVGCHHYHDGGEGAHPTTAAENHNGKELELRGEALQVVHINFGRSLVARLLMSDHRSVAGFYRSSGCTDVISN
jgi:hypothetical protein